MENEIFKGMPANDKTGTTARQAAELSMVIFKDIQ
jgi:hypothetical protein